MTTILFCHLGIVASHGALDFNHPSCTLKYLVAMLSVMVVFITLLPTKGWSQVKLFPEYPSLGSLFQTDVWTSVHQKTAFPNLRSLIRSIRSWWSNFYFLWNFLLQFGIILIQFSTSLWDSQYLMKRSETQLLAARLTINDNHLITASVLLIQFGVEIEFVNITVTVKICECVFVVNLKFVCLFVCYIFV